MKKHYPIYLIICIIAVPVLLEGICRLSSPKSDYLIFRGVRHEKKKPEGVTRIILLGGSAVYDTVDDYLKSWPVMLSRKLGPQYEVINMAFYSETSTDEFEDLYNYASLLDPDIIFVMDGFNDIYNLFHHYSHWIAIYDKRSRDLVGNKLKLRHYHHVLFKNCCVYKHLNTFVETIKRKLSLQARPKEYFIYDEPGQSNFFASEHLWGFLADTYAAIYYKNLDKMAEIAKNNDAELIIAFQPDLSAKAFLEGVTPKERAEYLKIIKNNETTWLRLISVLYPLGWKIVGEIGEKHGLRTYNFNALLKGDMSEYFDGNVHFTDKGRRWISDLVYKIIK